MSGVCTSLVDEVARGFAFFQVGGEAEAVVVGVEDLDLAGALGEVGGALEDVGSAKLPLFIEGFDVGDGCPDPGAGVSLAAFAEHEGAGAAANGGVPGHLPGDFEAEDAGVVVEAGGEVGDAEDGDGVVEEDLFGGCFRCGFVGCFVGGHVASVGVVRGLGSA